MSRTYPVIIEQDEDGMYVATMPTIPGCYTQGRTKTQALERIREAIQACDMSPEKFVGIYKVSV